MTAQALSIDHRAVDVYNDAVRRTFAFLKDTQRQDDLYTKSIPLPDNAGHLLPMCALHSDDANLIALLSRWRRENADAFPTQFPVTDEGTANWLRLRLLNVEDRLLFLVVNRHGYPVGHLGLANALNDERTVEIDNVVRGEKQGDAGIMGKALQVLIGWVNEFLAPETICLRVFQDNEHAVGFYHRHGFVDDGVIPLVRHIDGDRIAYVPAESDDADRYFLRMVYRAPAEYEPDSLIQTAGPSISPREVSYANDATRTGWRQNWSGYLTRFESKFAEYIGVRYALPISSATGAMQIALLALGIGPGDEVIIPDLTWVATGNAVAYTGATPVFAEVDADSWCLDPTSFGALITERTKAVMPVHLYGHPARMDKILEIADRHHITVVEDAAPAVGAEFQGRRVGSFGAFSTFSFQGAKILVSGEGGMLLTDDRALYEKAHKIWHIGSVNGTFWIDALGWKYKLSNVQAAIGLGQLEHLDEMIEDKRRIFQWYAEGLADVPHITLSVEQPWARSIYWMTSIELDEAAGMSRDDLRAELKKRLIDTRPVFPAISQYPHWRVRQPTQPIARRIGDQGINLPSGVSLKRAQVDYICRNIRDILTHSE